MKDKIKAELSNIRLFALWMRDIDIEKLTAEQCQYLIEVQESANNHRDALEKLEKVLMNVVP